MSTEQLLSIKNLNIYLQEHGSDTRNQIIHNVSFDLEKGKVLGIVGGSGSGKTLTSLSVLSLLHDKFSVTGSIHFNGADLLQLPERKIRKIRGKEIALIPQNPMASFNPIISIGEHMVESMRSHQKLTRKIAKELAIYYLEKMNFADPSDLISQYPFQLSGGMLQRVLIAITLSLQPSLIIADEPTTALDKVTEDHILHQLEIMKEEYDTSMLLVSHDFHVVSRLADEVAVIHNGMLVEKGSIVNVFRQPNHSYTKQLIDASIRLKREKP
ncbi:ABC transporter ATP-binding protein [Gracilibacillus oryzae]|uniref:ABC transporter ATP-binding protein n=1 Tax=Gracilibacillus oryzae TaxID=1672701 RepID=A0A7C8KQ28_9BACI|nr:ABC transporter ATP-binding protein [Gracilibacillus oryzae]KAB8126587.1 ABC transporter ATP-binding protein [Gracilibacillus oryzae]